VATLATAGDIENVEATSISGRKKDRNRRKRFLKPKDKK
jgi:hypothetical protein